MLTGHCPKLPLWVVLLLPPQGAPAGRTGATHDSTNRNLLCSERQGICGYWVAVLLRLQQSRISIDGKGSGHRNPKTLSGGGQFQHNRPGSVPWLARRSARPGTQRYRRSLESGYQLHGSRNPGNRPTPDPRSAPRGLRRRHRRDYSIHRPEVNRVRQEMRLPLLPAVSRPPETNGQTAPAPSQ